MNPSQLGFTMIGEDPEARDHEVWQQPATLIVIAVPKGGCSASDLVRIIWHAGACKARKNIREKHQAYLEALK